MSEVKCKECGYTPMKPYHYTPLEHIDGRVVLKYRCPICGYIHSVLGETGDMEYVV